MKDAALVAVGFASVVLCCTLVASGPPDEIAVAGVSRGSLAIALGVLSLLAWGLFFFSK